MPVVVGTAVAVAVLQVWVFAIAIPHGFDQRDVIPVADLVVWAFVDGVLLQSVNLSYSSRYVWM